MVFFISKASIFIIILCILNFIIGNFCYAQNPGQYDPSFNLIDDGTYGDGKGFSSVWNTEVKSIAVQPDGKVVAIGDFTTYNGEPSRGIVRINSDGSIDKSFNVGSGFNLSPMCIKILMDGKILVGGNFTSYNGVYRPKIIRLNSDGTPDISFNPGSGADNGGYILSVDLFESKIIVGGFFNSFNGVARNHICKLNEDGTIDETFDPGYGFDAAVYAVLVHDDGKILAGGGFEDINGIERRKIVRLNSNGTVDLGFDPGLNIETAVRDMVLTGEGKIVVGMLNGVRRLNTDGSLDTGYLNEAEFDGYIHKLLLLSDQRLVVGGEFDSIDGISCKKLAVLNTDGTIDTSFDLTKGFDNSVYAIGQQVDGDLMVGGTFSLFDETRVGRIARLRLNATLDDYFNIGTGFAGYASIGQICIQRDDKIVASGQFTSFNGVKVNNIIRLNSDGSLDPSFNPGAGLDLPPYCMVLQEDEKILVAGLFNSYNGYPRKGIARLNPDGSLDETFNPGSGFDYVVQCMVVQPDGKVIVGGYFTEYNGAPVNRIARLNTDGTLDLSFNPGEGSNDGVRLLGLLKDGKIIAAGSFTEFDGHPRKQLVRLTSNGNIDLSFSVDQGFNGYLHDMIVEDDGKIIVSGYFDRFNNISRHGVAKLNANGTLNSFDLRLPIQQSFVPIIFRQSDNKLLIYVLSSNIFLSRYNLNGGLDNSYDMSARFNGTIEAIAEQSDGKLIIGGSFSKIDNIWRNKIARIIGCLDPEATITQSGNELHAGIRGDLQYQWIDCNTNDVIQDEKMASFTPSSSGSYTVKVSDGACFKVADCYNFSITSVLGETIDDFILVYPNPSHGEFKIVFSNSRNYPVEITINSIQGAHFFKQVYDSVFDRGNITISLPSAEWPKGVYVVKISDTVTSRFKKIIIR
ncbi:MAG: T9SS type A sorting domain-containing protein [Cyclobacteriaceae bacterium]|nr:T9SS type A sorting domain-containing protein [Cyclobacteriaceae bacterium]UYN88293.1 MAG: T9SS type A sorting domain-containing protein [Cyclobacteriaceae bacterium]